MENPGKVKVSIKDNMQDQWKEWPEHSHDQISGELSLFLFEFRGEWN